MTGRVFLFVLLLLVPVLPALASEAEGAARVRPLLLKSESGRTSPLTSRPRAGGVSPPSVEPTNSRPRPGGPQVIDVNRLAMRDTKSYCGILLDDNNRKPVCRLRFNRSQKYLGLIDGEKNEERVPISSLDELYQHADRLKATVKSCEQPAAVTGQLTS